MSIGDWIKQIRAEMGITQQHIAEKCHVVFTHVAMWELGHRTPQPQYVGIIEQMYSEYQATKRDDWFIAGDKNFPQKLREFRLKRRLTQVELAEKVGVNRQAVLNWEKGIEPESSNIQALRKLQEQTDGNAESDKFFENFPEKMKGLQTRLTCTIGELSAMLGVSKRSVDNWLAGKTVPPISIVRLIEDFCAQRNIDFNDLSGAAKISPDEVRELRNMMDLTQVELADSISASRSSITNWEQGTASPSAIHQRKLISLRNQAQSDLSNKLNFLLNDKGFSFEELAQELNDIINQESEDSDNKTSKLRKNSISKWVAKTGWPNEQERAAIDDLCAKFDYKAKEGTDVINNLSPG